MWGGGKVFVRSFVLAFLYKVKIILKVAYDILNSDTQNLVLISIV